MQKKKNAYRQNYAGRVPPERELKNIYNSSTNAGHEILVGITSEVGQFEIVRSTQRQSKRCHYQIIGRALFAWIVHSRSRWALQAQLSLAPKRPCARLDCS